MNKTIIVAFIITIAIVFSVNSIVKEVPDLSETDVIGTYYYSECVYLHPLSSSTIDYQTELYMHNISFDVSEFKFAIIDKVNDTTKNYWDIEFTKVDLYLDLDEFGRLQLDDFLESVDTRYDVYSAGTKLDYVIFFSGENTFIAESKMLGGGNNIFTIFKIFSTGKLVNTFTNVHSTILLS